MITTNPFQWLWHNFMQWLTNTTILGAPLWLWIAAGIAAIAAIIATAHRSHRHIPQY